MGTYVISPPAGVTETDAGRIERFLEGRGLVVDSVEVLQTRDGVLTYVIVANAHPATVLLNYSREATPKDAATTTLAAIKSRLIDGSATIADVRTCLVALLTLHDI